MRVHNIIYNCTPIRTLYFTHQQNRQTSRALVQGLHKRSNKTPSLSRGQGAFPARSTDCNCKGICSGFMKLGNGVYLRLEYMSDVKIPGNDLSWWVSDLGTCDGRQRQGRQKA